VSATVGLGASLGALAMLFVQRHHPGLLDAVALQSGSYFTATLDPQESGYERFQHICSAVSALAAGPATATVPVLITCGIVEENRANNEQLATALQGQGYRVEIHLVPDAHTMVGWRDAWSPGLERLLDTVAGQP
jgi:enterochelin esterase family protein